MEIKTKYQYSYFIYPYVVEEKKYEKYLYHLLNNKNCKIKIFNKNKDAELYTYFLPKIRDFMFWSFEFSQNRINKLEEFDNRMKATLLSKYPCTIFEYEINKDIQGKTDRDDGIFFNIRKVEIICFNTGICFLNIKTILDEESSLDDLYKFNYKFRDINSSVSKLNDFQNIKIQTDTFQDVKGILAFIKDIVGSNNKAKNLNIDTDRFITYSYACIGQENWGQEESISYKNNKVETILLTSDINTNNYTKLPQKFENEYLYSYVFELYKKLYLKKLNQEFRVNYKVELTRNKYIKFTKNIWIEETTNDEDGLILVDKWKNELEINRIFFEVKQRYDIMYKNKNIEKIAKSNKWIAIILVILILINIINSIKLIKG